MTEQSDIPIVKRDESYEQFYRREYGRLVGLAYVLSGSRSGAEDLAQEALAAAFRQWDRIEQPGAWVRRVLTNQSVSQVRRRIVESKTLKRLAGSSHASLPGISTQGEEVWDAVRRLPQRQAQSVALFYLEDLPLEEIAGILDCSVGSVKTHLKRARQTLARRPDIKEGQR